MGGGGTETETEKDRDRDNTFTQVTLWLKHDAICVFRKLPKTDQSAEIIDLQSGFVYSIAYVIYIACSPEKERQTHSGLTRAVLFIRSIVAVDDRVATDSFRQTVPQTTRVAGKLALATA